MALISPRTVDLEGKVTFSGSSLNLRDGRTGSATRAAGSPPGTHLIWLTAACLAVSAQLWDRVGGLAEDYFMYWEDVDFNYRCCAVGATTILREDLTVVHDQGGTQGPRHGRAKSALYYFYNARNRMLFAARHLDRGRGLGLVVADAQGHLGDPAAGRPAATGGPPQLLLAAARGGLSGMVIGAKALTRRALELVDRPVAAARPGERIRRWRRFGDEGQGHDQDQHAQPAVERREEDVPHRQCDWRR